MKVGGAGIGYTSGTIYKRHKYTTYTPGSKYDRFGRFGLLNTRNLSAMNRQAFNKYNDSFSLVGYSAFDATQTESMGRSELVAERYAKQVQDAINQLTKQGGTATTTTGTILDQTT